MRYTYDLNANGCLILYADNSDRQEMCANAQLISAAPDLLEAARQAVELVRTARRYFPKSIRDSDAFTLENTNAAISKAIAKAEGR